MITKQQIIKLKAAEKEFLDTVNKVTAEYRTEVRKVIQAIDKEKMNKLRRDLGI